jgi:hypothetical protein
MAVAQSQEDRSMMSLPIPPLGIGVPEAVGGVVLGAVLLLWGRKVHRAVAGLGAAGGGVVLGAPVAHQMTGLDLLVAQVIAGGTLGLVGAVAARIVWAVLAGAIFATAAGGAVLLAYPACWPASPEVPAAGASIYAWAVAASNVVRSALASVWNEHQGMLLLATCPAGLAPLVVALFRPRLAAVFVTTLLGSACMVVGGLIVAGKFSLNLWVSAWANPHVPAIVAAALLVIGLIFQFRAAKAADGKKDAKGGPGKGETPQPDGGGKKK